ncbi:MAG TPA: hypothetical protein VMH04_01115 [Candidatus Solibacter sp.]|nr:hypothetical protein [Candidatus Solibacter sp.]
MAAENNPYRAKFPIGATVRVKSAGQLEAFARSGRLRHPPSGNQIACGGKTDSVRRITFSAGAGVLYELQTAPGWWHEDLLEKRVAYSPLLPHVQEALKSIEPSRDGELLYYPCRVVLKSGEACDTVYIVAEKPYIRHWGVYPENDPGKRWIRMEDVASVAESPTRLPAQFANELYKRGESGMGYTIFTVVFADGRLQACASGNAIDFIRYPTGKGPKDVVAVLPHEGRRDDSLVKSPEWYWCIYSE